MKMVPRLPWWRNGGRAQARVPRVGAVLASGAIGNSALLLRSAFGSRIPALGTGLYASQYMVLARYKERIDAHKNPFRASSPTTGFRQAGFKLENILRLRGHRHALARRGA